MQANESTGMIVSLIIFIALMLFAWWMSRRPAASRPTERSMATPVQEDAPVVGGAADSTDLTIIEGIGPVIQKTLNAAGILTLSQLASAPVERLQSILDAAGLRLGDPATWPEQAALAARGDWDQFKQFTETLKAGRRV